MRVLVAITVLWSLLAVTKGLEISVDLSQTKDVSKLLYGVFFEEINHAGEGGLYAELLQDRSFDALAILNNFPNGKEEYKEVTFPVQSQSTTNVTNNYIVYNSQWDQVTKQDKLAEHGLPNRDQPLAWAALDSTKAFFTKSDPLSPHNAIAVNVTTSAGMGGLSNGGYWGIPVEKDERYHFSVFIKGSTEAVVHIKLQSKGGGKIYAEAVSEGVQDYWQQFSANLTSMDTDYNAELVLQLEEPGSIVIDSLSLFPMSHFRYGRNPYPFRKDLLKTLKSLAPRFIRFPGGCYVEGGNWLKNRFPWQTNVGANYNRTGHLNDIWGYWSTDGLGLYEYMQLASELRAEPIYVVNNGISHQETTSPDRLGPFIAETLNALEFIMGDENSTWGAMRISMGKKKPWNLNYLAIGNEDCGRPNYREDYDKFYAAIKDQYPKMTLIANCDLGQGSKTELYDWHTYDDSQTMFNRIHEFDGLERGKNPPVFVSEYAVTADGGLGNLRAAVAEAAFMTGLERNSDIVQLASYAPLLTHVEARAWSPDLIVFDNHRIYHTPSYLVQQLFSKFQGLKYAETAVPNGMENKVAASTTCVDVNCDQVAIKVINFATTQQSVKLSLNGLKDHHFGPGIGAVLYKITGDHPEDENSFDNPENVKLSSDLVDLTWSRDGQTSATVIDLSPMSVNLLALRTDVYHSTHKL